MSQNSLIKSYVILECLEYIRAKIGLIIFVIFFFVNWDNNLQAIKSSLAMLRWKLMGEFILGRNPERDEMYLELYSIKTSLIYAHTITSALFAFIIGFLIVQLIDSMLAPKSLMSPHVRRLRRWARKEAIELETKEKLILTVKRDQAQKEMAFKIIRDLEEIIQQYQLIAAAYNPTVLKKAKLSKTDKTIGDLFDEQLEIKAKPKGFRRAIKFLRKF